MIRFLDSTLSEARAAGCDCVQYKYDGSFTQVLTLADGRYRLKYKPYETENELEYHTGISPGVACTLIASYRPILNKIYVFDCWIVEEPPHHVVDLRREPYRSRYVATRIQLKLLNGPFTLVESFPIERAQEMWRTIDSVPNAKGLVFRNSKDDARATVRVARWYPEVPRALT